MYHSKKIGIFISHIMGYYQKHVCQGIIDRAKDYGYTVDIFASLDGENLGTYGSGEQSILKLPDYADYNGIIFASETYPLTELKEQIFSTLREAPACPVVEIAAESRRFPAIALDNNSMFTLLTEHMIRVHGCRRICYLGCSEERCFSDLREAFYRKAMAASGLPVTEQEVFSCGYDQNEVRDALSCFFAGKERPDAVICYNDRMALLLLLAAAEAGFSVPEDFAVTGCDDTDDGKNTAPALTTVTFPVYELGCCAVDTLVKLIQKESVAPVTQVSAEPVFRGSCGCMNVPDLNPLYFHQALNRRIEALESSILSSMRMSAASQRITDLEEGMDLLEDYIRGIEHCKEFYLCLYSDWNSVSSRILELAGQEQEELREDAEILLKLGVRDGKRLPECSFQRTSTSTGKEPGAGCHSLLPGCISRGFDSSYIYTPLFFEEKRFGYVALAYEDNRIDYHFQLVHWFMNISQMLKNICEAKYTSLLVKHLDELKTRDPLTGLYNEHGFCERAKLLFEEAAKKSETVTCFHFNPDQPAKINDTLLRQERDFAIQVMGQALSNTIRANDLCARTTGDHFYLLTRGCTKKDADDLLARVNQYLYNYQKLSHKNYTISVNAGYASLLTENGVTRQEAMRLFKEASKNHH